MTRTKLLCSTAVACVSLFQSAAWSAPAVSGRLTGEITAVRLGYNRLPLATNTLSVSGAMQDGRFSVDIIPIKTEDEIEEHAGWDLQTLYFIQRFPEMPRRNMPRDKSLGYMEPTVFSRYATHPATGLLMALADSNAISALTSSSGTPILLGTVRAYPEEKSRFVLDYRDFGDWSVDAICPGFSVDDHFKLLPLESEVYSGGFRRWRFMADTLERAQDYRTIHFLYERFRPKHKEENPTNAEDVVQDWKIEGNVKLAYESIAKLECRPEVHESSLVVLDFRARDEFAREAGNYDKDHLIHSLLTNRTWSIDERQAIKGVAATQFGIQLMSQRQKRLARYRWVFYSVAAVVFACPLVIALRRRATNSK